MAGPIFKKTLLADHNLDLFRNLNHLTVLVLLDARLNQDGILNVVKRLGHLKCLWLHLNDYQFEIDAAAYIKMVDICRRRDGKLVIHSNKSIITKDVREITCEFVKFENYTELRLI